MELNVQKLRAALFEAPFTHLALAQKSARSSNREARAAERWWLHQRSRPQMRDALTGLSRYIGTPEVSKHRILVFVPASVLPSGSVYAIARDDDIAFGILHSRFHELWSLALGTSLEDRPRYTPTSTFETFPFPAGLSPRLKPENYVNSHSDKIATAAQALSGLRENWLNPPEWSDCVPEVVPGYPDRIVAKPGHEAELNRRTLTNLYNAKPAWLVNAHRELDQAVAAAYGWTDYTPKMADDEILARLLSSNLQRASA